MSSATFHTASMSVQVVFCGEVLKAKRIDPRYLRVADDPVEPPNLVRFSGRRSSKGQLPPRLFHPTPVILLMLATVARRLGDRHFRRRTDCAPRSPCHP